MQKNIFLLVVSFYFYLTTTKEYSRDEITKSSHISQLKPKKSLIKLYINDTKKEKELPSTTVHAKYKRDAKSQFPF